MLKALPVVGLIGVGVYFSGVLGLGGYSRNVGRPPAEVMAALEDLDITAQPGAPGSTAEAAGGIKPVFRIEKAADHLQLVCNERRQGRDQDDGLSGADRRRQADPHHDSRGTRRCAGRFRVTRLPFEGYHHGSVRHGDRERGQQARHADPMAIPSCARRSWTSSRWTIWPRPPGKVRACCCDRRNDQDRVRLQAYEAELRRNGCKIGPAADGNFEHRGRPCNRPQPPCSPPSSSLRWRERRQCPRTIRPSRA